MAHVYRDQDNLPGGGRRPIMANVLAVETMLPSGIYWLEWTAAGAVPLSGGPFAPPITVTGKLHYGRSWLTLPLRLTVPACELRSDR